MEDKTFNESIRVANRIARQVADQAANGPMIRCICAAANQVTDSIELALFRAGHINEMGGWLPRMRPSDYGVSEEPPEGGQHERTQGS